MHANAITWDNWALDQAFQALVQHGLEVLLLPAQGTRGLIDMNDAGQMIATE
jgi:hypothetical protein